MDAGSRTAPSGFPPARPLPAGSSLPRGDAARGWVGPGEARGGGAQRYWGTSQAPGRQRASRGVCFRADATPGLLLLMLFGGPGRVVQ